MMIKLKIFYCLAAVSASQQSIGEDACAFAFRPMAFISSHPLSPSKHLNSQRENSDEEQHDGSADYFEDSLSKRIADVERSDASFLDGLRRRVNSLSRSEDLEERLTGPNSVVDLPVLCFDALLPNQRLTGSTTDPTFCTLLRKLGLGGYFVMTSLNGRQRKIRRFGVVAKIDFIDMEGDLADCTAVSFALRGCQRCEILGPSASMSGRIGRWRRGYDQDGEESRLGWGEERFVDRLGGQPRDRASTELGIDKPATEWTTNEILVIEEETEGAEPATVDHATRLVPLVEKWIDLASDPATYDNADVVAATRIRPGGTGPAANVAGLLRKVQSELGTMPRPSAPTRFCLWAAALVNPLPPLGVSTECRGAILEAGDARRRLEILERTLVKSINNLDGTRPLNM